MAKRKVLVSGATGFLGIPLVAALRERDDDVTILTRGESGPGQIHWDPASGHLGCEEIDGFDAVVHLAGETIAGVWTNAKKRRIVESREKGTDLLTRSFESIEHKPSVFVSSSAIGIYGSRGDEVLTEDSGKGGGFLADLVETWEAAAQPARDAGIRTVNLRLGLILAESGGMMGPMKPQFKLGLGGKLGDGKQWWSWVSRHDVIRAFLFAIDSPSIEGAYNVAAPSPVTNAEFTKELGHALHRPTILPAPKFALKLTMREMADEMLLASQRIDSAKIQRAGFEFDDVQLKPTLQELFN